MTVVEHEALRELAVDLLPGVVELRRRIHRHPELGLQLPETQAAIVDALEPLGFDIRLGESTTSVVADLVGPEPGRTILLRADMDALPMPEDTAVDFASEVEGAMHACGHDSHVAMLVGAARLLAEMRSSLRGRVRFMFQPGEEGYHGAREMVAEGVADGVDGAFAIHITPNAPAGVVIGRAGPLLASDDLMQIEVRGVGGHASSPHIANDPIPVACEIVSALQTFVARRVNVFDPAVVTIASINAGTTSNVIPEVAYMRGTIRTTSDGTRKHVKAGVTRTVQGVAAAHGMTAEVRFDDGYAVTTNDTDFVDRVERVVGASLGEGRFIRVPTPVMGAEDFSYVLSEVPGAIVFLGVCPEGQNPAHAPGCHSNRMMLEETAMADGIALHAAIALDFLGDTD